MKKLFAFMAISLLPILFSSCGSDEDDMSTIIIGKWHVYDVTGNQHTDSPIEAVALWIIFNTDGTYKTTYNKLPETGTYTFDGSNLVFNGGFNWKVTFSQDKKYMDFSDWIWIRE